MLRALWLILRLAILVVGVIKIADVPGQVKIDWQDYTFSINLGFFLLICIGFVLLTIFIFQTIKTFVDFPKSYRRYREVRRQEKGYKALTIGLTAVAAGDTKAALAQARKARKFMPADTGLPLLLEAQAARLDGREEDAAKSFVQLLENKDASFLGVRGLLQSALDSGDTDGSLALAEKALALHPKQPWILKIVYDLRIRNKRWKLAYDVLIKIEKYGAVASAQIRSDRMALLLAQGDDAAHNGIVNDAKEYFSKALKIDPSFAPAATRLAGIYVHGLHFRKARSLIEKAWKIAPHPDLFESWCKLIEPKRAEDAIAQVRWAEKLMKLNPQSAQGWIGTARAAMAASLWGEARAFLQRAEMIEQSPVLYKLYAELEDRTDGDRHAMRDWLLKASTAPPPKVWICRQSGRVYPAWSPVAEPHGSFNTIVWDYAANAGSSLQLSQRSVMAEALIEAPAA